MVINIYLKMNFNKFIMFSESWRNNIVLYASAYFTVSQYTDNFKQAVEVKNRKMCDFLFFLK